MNKYIKSTFMIAFIEFYFFTYIFLHFIFKKHIFLSFLNSRLDFTVESSKEFGLVRYSDSDSD